MIETALDMDAHSYCRDSRIVIVAGARVECYERGAGTLSDRRVS